MGIPGLGVYTPRPFSFSSAYPVNPFGVNEAKMEDLRRRMEAVGLREKEIAERFIRSGGPGGQNVNKVATCVHLRHLPTGLEVKAQTERSQALNRFLARRWLVSKLEEKILGAFSEQQRRAEKIRRQKRRRSRRAKEKMLAVKRRRSLTKQLRSRPSLDDA